MEELTSDIEDNQRLPPKTLAVRPFVHVHQPPEPSARQPTPQASSTMMDTNRDDGNSRSAYPANLPSLLGNINSPPRLTLTTDGSRDRPRSANKLSTPGKRLYQPIPDNPVDVNSGFNQPPVGAGESSSDSSSRTSGLS